MSEAKTDMQTLAEKIKGIRIAMLTTQDDDGTLRSRPMFTQDTEFDGEVWFFTGAGSPKVDETRKHQQVNLSYAKPEDDLYISVSGTAEVVRDRAKAEELWNPILKTWFPDGLDDPELALLRVNVSKAEYWDSPDSKVVHLAGFVKAMVTGEPPHPGENEKLNFENKGG